TARGGGAGGVCFRQERQKRVARKSLQEPAIKRSTFLGSRTRDLDISASGVLTTTLSLGTSRDFLEEGRTPNGPDCANRSRPFLGGPARTRAVPKPPVARALVSPLRGERDGPQRAPELQRRLRAFLGVLLETGHDDRLERRRERRAGPAPRPHRLFSDVRAEDFRRGS